MFLFIKSQISKVFIFFLLLFSVFFNQHYANLGVFPIDTFLHFDAGYRILNGEHPFKDYWTMAAPLVDYLQAFFFYFFGVSWKSYVLHASLLNALLTISTYFVLRNFNLNIYYSFFYSLLFSILAYPISGTPFIDHHAAFFSLLGVYSLLLAINNKNKFYCFLVPIFLGLGFFSKQVPSSYIILFIVFILVLYSLKERNFGYIKYSFLGATLFIFVILTFGYLQEIQFSSFLDQYIFYPPTIGKERYENLHFGFRGIIGHFKFVYLAIIPLFFINIRNFFLDKKYIYHNDFFVFLILLLLTFSFILHQVLTKNQTFIFFLIPVLTAFSQISLKKINFKFNNLLYLIIISLCLFAAVKYHLRFNENRKFHELRNVNFQLSTNADKIDEKLSGLNWITYDFKDNPIEEIKFINQIKSHFESDSRNKIVITNYSFFSSILNEKTFSPSRVFAGDGTTNPMKNNKYAIKYKKLMINLIKKNNISVIYIIAPLDSTNIYDYFEKQCFKETSVLERLKSYEIKNCNEING